MKKLVIFDMDGLIFDSEYTFMVTLREVMADHGLSLPRPVYEETLGLSQEDTRTVIEKYYGKEAPFDDIYREGRLRLNARAGREALPVKPGIRELLSGLKAAGIPACVASSSPRRTIDIYLGSAGLTESFSFVISGEDITHSKPNPEIFLRCCEHFGVAPKDALVLEDSENGIRAALAGGIPVICIPDMKQPEEALLTRTAAVCADGLEVLHFLALPSFSS